ncbi:phage tail sheath subtilisin-like domain-containing protein [Pseudomonas sp. YeP6b]|uniref:phage tail sheath subtilisin-like domain-containing protein n=1 Tax=Pseudomonas sp. YeP6b TaxID=2861775 RepID=UPI0021D94460|nr:phage tail sheath subtilisin-like domain-containing protein [Pseudomonas sp. YeP6b]UXZ20662.1 phage tail sheath subtilisin-like domain-containing protein [Pseudomonas sp. YeP6b]
MSVGFNTIPSDIRVPLFYAELDNSQANTAQESLRRLIIGQVNDDADSEDIGRLVLVSRTAQATLIGGQGSMLAAMHKRLRSIDVAGEVWCLPLKVETGSTATATVTVTGAATEAGLLYLYVGGKRVRSIVPALSSATAVAAALAKAINDDIELPVKAAAAESVVTLTCKFKGELGNDIALQLNRLGRANGEFTPAGITAAVTPMTGGTGTPEMSVALAALGDEPFEFIAQPWTDPTTLDAWKAAMDESSGRWSWSKQLYGHVYSAKRGSLGQLVAAGRVRNDPHICIGGIEKSLPNPVWEVVAQFMARTAVFISADPARPTQTGELGAIQPAAASDRFLIDEAQSLLSNGIATFNYSAGSMRIQRAVTTYQRNAYGQADDSYLDSEPLHQSAHVIRFLRSRITSKYGRHKLGNDGTAFGPGQAIVTPMVIRGELIAAYGELERAGLVENAEMFKANLIVERDPNNPARLNVLFPPDLVNQLRVFALLYQFRSQYPEAA